MSKHYECPLESYFAQNEMGNWYPCYVRGVGPTEELARLHGEMLCAQKRHEIAWALYAGEETPYRLNGEVME